MDEGIFYIIPLLLLLLIYIFLGAMSCSVVVIWSAGLGLSQHI